MQDLSIKIRTGYSDHDNIVFQEIEDIHGQIIRKSVDVAALQLDLAIRNRLINLGWTPPPNSEGTGLES